MKTLVISKPTYTHILPLVEFPSDGDTFYIKESIDVLSSYGSVVALILAKYDIDTDFTGAVGGDEISNVVIELFEKNKVKYKYIERVYGQKTAASYKIYNQKTNKYTTVIEGANKLALTRYKYDFVPDVIIMDDKDYSANLAAINNYPDANLIFIGDKFNKESSVYCNKCKYVISTLSFASGATGITQDLNKPKGIVELFQKYIDLYNSNLIIKLDNFDLLYCVGDEVRLIKNINKNIANKDSIYYGILIYFLINNYSIEDSIKLTNKTMLSANNEIDLLLDIPDYKVVQTIIDEFKLALSQKPVETLPNNSEVVEQFQVQQVPIADISGSQVNQGVDNNMNFSQNQQMNMQMNSQVNQQVFAQPVRNPVQQQVQAEVQVFQNQINNVNSGVNNGESI